MDLDQILKTADRLNENAFSLSDSRWHLQKSRNAAVHKGSVCNCLTSALQVKKKRDQKTTCF